MAYQERPFLGRIDWPAIFAAVVIGLGVTLLLVVFGAAVGITAAEGADAGTVSTAIGGWTILSALIGTFVGTFIGGRVTRSFQPGSPLYHGLASWSFVTLATIWLGVSGVAGLLGTALQTAGDVAGEVGVPDTEGVPTEAPEGALEAIAWGGWALAIGLLVTLGISLLGWWLGQRSQPLAHDPADTERPLARDRAVAGDRVVDGDRVVPRR